MRTLIRSMGLLIAATAVLILLGVPTSERARATPAPPTITNADFAQTEGTACPLCSVELWGDVGADPDVFLGYTVADAAGYWSIPGQAGAPSVFAVAHDGFGYSPPSELFPTLFCVNPTCIAGLHESTYLTPAGVFNHCTARVFQQDLDAVLANVFGNIDCTTAHGGTFSGTFEHSTSMLDVILSYTSTTQQFHAWGTFTPDGTSGSGYWDCYPATCGGPFSWTNSRLTTMAAARYSPTSGGFVVWENWRASVFVDVGALASDTTISIEPMPLPEAPSSGVAVLSRAFRFGPEGTTFLQPVTVRIRFTTDDLIAGMDPNSVRAMVWDGASQQWVYVGGTVFLVTAGEYELHFQLDHFSDYGFFDCGSIDNDGDGQGNPCDLDDDADGCTDEEERGADHTLGGQRGPLNYYDFYDVTGDRFIALDDTLVILEHFGHGPADDPLDEFLDREVYDASKPWLASASDTGVDLIDALANLGSFGDGCKGVPKA